MARTQPHSLESQELQELFDKPIIASASIRSSMLFTMLPGAVRTRISAMPSLKRSLSSYSVRSRQASTVALNKRPQSVDLSACTTRSKGSGQPSPKALMQAFPMIEKNETSGSNWKYANQGFDLLQLAVAESQNQDEDSLAFARHLYLHAMAYLLRGLPNELAEAETASLRAALPASLQQLKVDDRSASTSTHQGPPSLLHRLLASGIVHLFLFTSFILPYLKLLLRNAYKYERTHHISERLFAAVLDITDQMGKRGLGIVGAVLNGGNGKVGALLAGTCAWWIDGISGGIHEGLGEGMAIIAAKDSQREVWRRP